jgi:DNA-binding protein HU-beta
MSACCDRGFDVNRTEMVDIISRQKEVDGTLVDCVLKAFVDLVILNVSVGESVTIRGFGRFDQKVRPSANLKHPRTGQPIATGERRTIAFRPSMKAKDQLNPVPLELSPRGDRTPCDATVALAGSASPAMRSTGISGDRLTPNDA